MDSYISCPFDPSHRIRTSKMQWHLHKDHSYKDRLKFKKVQCPFNVTHILNAVELDYHITVCPSSRNVMCFKYCLELPRQVGTVSIEEACAKEPKLCDEDWSGNHPTYDPHAACSNKAFTRPLISASKAKKKEYKKAERERINTLMKTQDEKLDIGKETQLDKPLRRPKNVAKAISDNDTCINATYANIDALVSKFKDISTTEDNAKQTAALSSSIASKKTSQKEDHDKYYKKERNNNLNEKDISIEKPKILYSNPRCAAKFTETMMARKHSAGRGFAIK